MIKNWELALLMFSLTVAVTMGAKGIADAIDRHGERCGDEQRKGLPRG